MLSWAIITCIHRSCEHVRCCGPSLVGYTNHVASDMPVLLQAPLQKYAAVLREKAAQRRAMHSSDEVQLNRKTSVLDGASDSDDEDERPLQQSQEADEMQQAAEVYRPALVSFLVLLNAYMPCHGAC